jgi:glycosyltransferase involved in cell wall biosynthesis
MKKALGNLFLFNRFMKNAASIQYLSDFDKEQSAFPNVRPIVQGSGIVSRKSKKTSFSKEGLKLIYVGRLDVNVKGLDLMIEAAKQHKSAFEDGNISVTIAGADPKGEMELKNTIEKHNLAGIITLEPAIYGDDKINKILEHDIFFQLSRTEAQCLGLMEAMDIGMPSLVTKGTSFFDVAKKYKIAIPVESTPESIGNIILSSLKDRHSLSTIGSNASRYIKENYNWDIVGGAMIEEYRTLLKDRINAK